MGKSQSEPTLNQLWPVFLQIVIINFWQFTAGSTFLHAPMTNLTAYARK